MIKPLARWWAMVSYRFKEERNAETYAINARAATWRATEKREMSERLNAEAAVIEERITVLEASMEAGYWECENGHEEPISTAFAGIELEISRNCSTCHKPMKFIRRDLMTP